MLVLSDGTYVLLRKKLHLPLLLMKDLALMLELVSTFLKYLDLDVVFAQSMEVKKQPATEATVIPTVHPTRSPKTISLDVVLELVLLPTEQPAVPSISSLAIVVGLFLDSTVETMDTMKPIWPPSLNILEEVFCVASTNAKTDIKRIPHTTLESNRPTHCKVLLFLFYLFLAQRNN